mmetsp:Transcript_19782/g.38751  ORF Transcript_19782/g.38751 Transcript_19782/m.38751 type:complete len:668 (+) Transcript_19782:43-2046(+)
MNRLTPRSLHTHTQTQPQLQSQVTHQSQSQLMHTSMLSCSGFTSDVDLSRLARSTACSPAPSTRPLRAAAVADDLLVEGPILVRQDSRPALHGGLAGAGVGGAAVQPSPTTELGDGDFLLASPLLSPICSSRLSPPMSATNSMHFLSSEPLSTSLTQHHGGSATPSLPSRAATALRARSPSSVPAQSSRNTTPMPVHGIDSQAKQLPAPIAVEALLRPAIRSESGGNVSRDVAPIREPVGPMLTEPLAVGIGSCSVARHYATPASDLGLGPALGSSFSPRQRGRAATSLPRQEFVGTEWDAKAGRINTTTVAAEGFNHQPRTNFLPQLAGPPLTGLQPPCLAGVSTPPQVPFQRQAVAVTTHFEPPLPVPSQTSILKVTGDVRQKQTGTLHSVPTETNRCTQTSASALPHFPVPTLVPRSRPNSPHVGNETRIAQPVMQKGIVVASNANITRLPLDEEALEVDEAAEVSNMDISADMPSPKSLVCPALQLSLGEATSPRTPQWPPAGGDTNTTDTSTPATSGSSGATCAGFIDGVMDIESKCRLARDPCDRLNVLPWASTRRPASPQMARRPWPATMQAVQAKALPHDANPLFVPDTAAIEGGVPQPCSVPQPGSRDEATWDFVKEHGKAQPEANLDAALARTLERLNGQLQILEDLVAHCEKCGEQ